MPDTADFLRLLLATGVVAMAIMAISFLSTRQLPLVETLAWLLLLVILPLLGPFLVILLRPGQPRPRSALRMHPVPQAVVFLADRWLQKLRLR